jgi:hypothetical protein
LRMSEAHGIELGLAPAGSQTLGRFEKRGATGVWTLSVQYPERQPIIDVSSTSEEQRQLAALR